MKRYVSIWFPNLLTDWLAIGKPELKDQVFVFTTSIHGKIVITAASKEAELQGIRVGALLADAKIIVSALQVFDDQPNLNHKLLTRIGKWAVRFAPIVAIDLPNGIILDSSGCTHLWNGEKGYLETILKRLRETGYSCRVAISDTIGTSWAIARYGKISAIVKPNQQFKALLPLPSRALRIEEAVIKRLHKLGLDQIEKFIQMPRSVLRRRFGEDFCIKIEQALGTAEESIKPLVIISPYQERLACLEPLRTRTAIQIAIKTLLETLCARLSNEGMGIRQATLTGYRLDGKITQIQIGTNQPTHKIAHLYQLFELKISTIQPDLGIELFVLHASQIEIVRIHQEKLWNGKPGLAAQNVVQLLDRLSGKIGAQAIRRYLPHEHYWPERSLRLAISIEELTEKKWQNANPRPMEMLPRPQAIQVTAPVPDYPPMNFRYKDELHLVKNADGPERIEREWWMEKGEHRDYYVLEDQKGQRYWVFRLGHYNQEKSGWFIHGFFA